MPERWILRQGTKRSGFRYVSAHGRAVPARVRARIDALRIPPAWTDVHVAASPSASVQAWGFDAKGRKQYRYHDRAVARAELRKYYRVRQLARDLGGIRADLARQLRGRRLTRQRVCAGVVALIAEGFFRVGNERYAEENRTFGIATLRKRHVEVHDDRVVFRYTGKKGIEQRQTVCERSLVRFVRELHRVPGARLFRYEEEGAWHDLTARDVNAYLHDDLDVRYTAKDFRTWGGTLRVATILEELGTPASAREAKSNVVTAIRLVAAELGNTPTVCRKSYVHPLVLARYLDDGDTIGPFLRDSRDAAARARRGAAAHRPEERALIAFLDRYFPERRRRPDRRRRERQAAVSDRRDDARAA